MQLGGTNRYGDQLKGKPLLAAGGAAPSAAGVERILQLSRRLELCWLLAGLILMGGAGAAVQ
jgi:cobalamin biosynthesis protein CobD/CbiB